VIGNSGVGKTSIISQYTNGKFSETYKETVKKNEIHKPYSVELIFF
jgi:GTPase SAR1 family protein